MIKFTMAVIILCILINFIEDCVELHKQEIEQFKSDLLEFLEKTFGKDKFEIFKSSLYDDGILRHIIYVPHYEWFKSPQYQWYEVYATNTDYHFNKIESKFN